MNGSWSAPIKNPVQWTADNLADKPGVDLSKPNINMKKKEIDLDHDGVTEVLIWDQVMMGQCGGPVLVFKQTKGKYKYIGDIGGTRIGVLPLGDDKKLRIAMFSRIRGRKGEIVTFTNDGSRFVLLSQEPIDTATKKGMQRYEEVFGGNR